MPLRHHSRIVSRISTKRRSGSREPGIRLCFHAGRAPPDRDNPTRHGMAAGRAWTRLVKY